MTDIAEDEGLSEAALLSNAGAAVFARSRECDDLAQLLQAVEIFERAAGICEDDDPARPMVFSNLGHALRTWHKLTGAPVPLARAASAARTAVSCLDDTDPSAGLVLTNLALTLGTLLNSGTAQPSVLGEALDAARRAVRVTPGDSPHLAARLEDLVRLLHVSVRDTGGEDAHAELVSAFRRLLAVMPAPDSGRPAVLAALFNALRNQYESTADPAALEAGVSVGKELAAEFRESDPHRYGAALSLAAVTTGDLHRRTGLRTWLLESISLWREALTAAPEGPHSMVGHMELCSHLVESGRLDDDRQALSEAVGAGRRAVAAGGGAEASGRLGAALAALGDREAVRHYRDAIRTSDTPGAQARWRSELSEALAKEGLADEALSLARAAAEGYRGRPGEVVALARLTGLLSRLARERSDPELMAEATGTARRTASLVPVGRAGRMTALHELGQQLFLHYKATFVRTLLDDAVSTARQALAAYRGDVPGEGAPVAVVKAGLGRSLHLLARLTRDEPTLAEAAGLLREAVASTDNGHPLLPSFKAELSGVLVAAADGTCAEEHVVREAVSLARDAAGQAGVEGLSALGRALTQLARSTGDPVAAEEGIDVVTRALSVHDRASSGCESDVVQRGALLMAHGDLLHERYRHTDHAGDLTAAVDAYAQALAVVPADHMSRPHLAAMHMALLAQRAAVTEDPQDEERMLRAGAEALAVITDPVGSTSLRVTLSVALQLRNSRTGDSADLDHAIRLCQEPLSGDALPDVARLPLHGQLSYLLRVRYSRTGERADIDQAVTHGRAAVAFHGTAPAELPRWRSDLSAALRERSESTGSLADIDEAIEQGRMAAESGETDGVGHHGTAVLQRFQSLGRLDDLHRAVLLARAAVTSGETDDGAALSNLGACLAQRHEEMGTSEDLDAAITAFEEAVGRTEPHHQARPNRLINLALGLCERYGRTGDEADFRAADAAAREAVHLAPGGHQLQVRALDTLGHVAAQRYARTSDPADLDDAISAARKAREVNDHPALGQMVQNLAGYLLDRFTVAGAAEDLEESIALCREGLEFDSQTTVKLRYTLGQALAARADLTGDALSEREAVEVLRAGATASTGRAEARLAAAVAWARFAERRSDASALEAYGHAIALQRILVSMGAARSDRERLLTRWRGLAGDAAAAALGAGRPDTSVELLEQGRSVLWSQLLDLRTDFTQVRDRAPELARRLVQVRDRLDRPPRRP
ncbi:hypothetical protein ACH4D4_05155 [Streptomyces pristinaespiralis]|uniref:hypothetical protein n=1 Tax=Streptomyces pristinaespiralis TaxID=38300 RepID=UPI0037B1C9C8